MFVLSYVMDEVLWCDWLLFFWEGCIIVDIILVVFLDDMGIVDFEVVFFVLIECD